MMMNELPSPEEIRVARYLHKMMEAGEPVTWSWNWYGETDSVRELFVYQAKQVLKLLAETQDGEQGLMKVLVEGGIVLKDATPTYSELLAAVKTLIEAKSQEKCPNPDCDNGKIYVEITPWKANVEDCPTCQGTGKKLKVDSPKLTEEIVEILREFTTFNHDDKLITFSPRAAAQKLIRLGYCNALLEGETKKVFDERDSSSR